MRAAIDVRWVKAHAKLQGIFKQDLELVGIVHFDGHIGAEKLCGEMNFQPTRVVRQQRISSGVRFVKTVTRKPFHQVKNLIGFGFRQAIDNRTFSKNFAVLGHLFRFFLTHGTAQQVCAAQTVTP